MSIQVIEKNVEVVLGQYRYVGQFVAWHWVWHGEYDEIGVKIWVYETWYYVQNYLCQSFKAKRSYKLLTTKFYVNYGTAYKDECLVDLYRADGDGEPSGAILDSGSFTQTGAFSWQECNWEQEYELTKDVQYCFVLRQLMVSYVESAYTNTLQVGTNNSLYTDGGLLESSWLPTTLESAVASPLPPHGWYDPADLPGGLIRDINFLNYGDVEGSLAGTISGISSLSGNIKKHKLLTLFIPGRQTDESEPNFYDPDLFWLPGEWTDSSTYVSPAWGDIGDHTYLPLGGGRWHDPLVVIGNNKVYIEDFY